MRKDVTDGSSDQAEAPSNVTLRHPFGSEAAWPFCLPLSNICAILHLFARAMNPCVVGFGPRSLHNRLVAALPGESRPGLKQSRY